MDVRDNNRVSPEALLARSHSRRSAASPGGVRAATVARSVVLRLLDRQTIGRLQVIDHTDGAVRMFGDRNGSHDGVAVYDAIVEIHDRRAWSALLREGSIGFGRGYVERWWSSPDPTAVAQLIIANIEPLDDLRNGLTRYTTPIADRARRLMPKRGRVQNRDEISSHYDLGNEFFRLFLDETMTYSSAVFPDPGASLADASTHKYDMVLDSLDLGPDHHLLEIGTGWGGLALRAAERTGCRVTTTTISAKQHQHARQRIRAAGLADQVEVVDLDWRDLRGQYDRVVSIEMIEAVDWRQYGRFFATIERCLKPEGRAVLQAICVPDRRYERTKNTEDFIRRFIFPGGFLPSLGAMIGALATSTRMQVLGVNDFSAHYAETLRRWRARFDEQHAEILELGLDERFVRLWRFYLAYCEAGFLERHCTVNQIALVGRDWRPTINEAPSKIR